MSFVVCVLVLFPVLLLVSPRLAVAGLVAAIVWQVINRTRSAAPPRRRWREEEFRDN